MVVDTKLTLGVLATVIGHTGWGCMPGFGRFLQDVAGLDAFVLLGGAYTASGLILFIFSIWRHGWHAMLSLPRIAYFIAISVGFAVSFVVALRYLSSVYVQLIILLVPFVVSLLTKVALKSTLPPYTVPALVISAAGSFVALFGDILVADASFVSSEWLGLGMAFVATVTLALVFLYIGSVSGEDGDKDSIPLECISSLSILPAGLLAIVVSLPTGTWEPVLSLSPLGWIVWALYSFGCVVFLMALFHGIRLVGATMSATLLPWRLVVAVLLGSSPLLREHISTYNIIGMSVVVVTLGLYLFAQYYLSKKSPKDDPLLPHRLVKSAAPSRAPSPRALSSILMPGTPRTPRSLSPRASRRGSPRSLSPRASPMDFSSTFFSPRSGNLQNSYLQFGYLMNGRLANTELISGSDHEVQQKLLPDD